MGRFMRWITFDCFGTLVDWNTGFDAILRPIAADKTTALIEAYHRVERVLEGDSPHRKYRDVMTTGLKAAADAAILPAAIRPGRHRGARARLQAVDLALPVLHADDGRHPGELGPRRAKLVPRHHARPRARRAPNLG